MNFSQYGDDLKNLVFIPELFGIDAEKFLNDDTYEIFNKEENIKELNNKKFPALFLYFSKELKTKHTIMYFHSNSCDLGQIDSELCHLHEHLHANILAIEYVGFGLCYLEGTPNQYNINRRALAAYNFLISLNMKSENILLFGRSIGTGVATKLVHNLKLLGKQVAGIILHAPYISIEKLVEDYFSYSSYFIQNIYDNFKNLQVVSNNSDSDIPLLLIHGKDDEIIGVEHSEFLMKNLNNKFKKASYPNDSYHNYYYVIDDLGIPIKTFLDTSSKSQYEKSVDIIIPKSFFKKDYTKKIINYMNENITENKLEKKIKNSEDVLLAPFIKKGKKKQTSTKGDKSLNGSFLNGTYKEKSTKRNKTKNNEEKYVNKSEEKNINSDKRKDTNVKKNEKSNNDKKVDYSIYKENKTTDEIKNLDFSFKGLQKEKNRISNRQKESDQKALKSEIRKQKKNNALQDENAISAIYNKNLANNRSKEKEPGLLGKTISDNEEQRIEKMKDVNNIPKPNRISEEEKNTAVDSVMPSSSEISNKNKHIEEEFKTEKIEEKKEKVKMVNKGKELIKGREENAGRMHVNESNMEDMCAIREHFEECYRKEKNIKEIDEQEKNVQEFEEKEYYHEKEENKEYYYKKDRNEEYYHEKEENKEYYYEKDRNEEYYYEKEENNEEKYVEEKKEEEYEMDEKNENESIYRIEKVNEKKYKKDKNEVEEKREDNEGQGDEANENFNINNYEVKDFKYYIKNNIINKEKIGCFMNKVIDNLNIEK